MMHDDKVNIGYNNANITDLQNLQFAIQAANIGTWHLHFNEPQSFVLDEQCCILLNIDYHQQVSLTEAFRYVHPDDKNGIYLAIETALRQPNNTNFDISFRVVNSKENLLNWIRFTGKSYFNDADKPIRFAGVAIDASPQQKLREKIDNHELQIAVQALAHKEIAASEARFRTIVEQSPIAIGILKGRQMIVETANDSILKLWGKNKSIIGLPLIEVLPELKEQPFIEMLENVFDTGIPFFGYATLAKLLRNEVLEDAFFDFVYTPMLGANNAITGVMVIATEVTTQVLAHIAKEESEHRFRSIVEEAPVATCLILGREMIIEVANEIMLEFWGKGSSIIGKPLKEALPELEGQSFFQILDDIFTTGKAYSAKDAPAELIVDGKIKTFYFDFTYKPLFNAAGEVYGIINMAIDVTEQVMARKKLEESELFSKNIINNSPVAKLVVIGENMTIKTINEHMLDIVDCDASVVGLPFVQAFPNLVDTPMYLRLKHVIATGQTYYQPEEKFDLTRYGKPYTGYYNVIYKALPNITGIFYGIIVTAVEVTGHVNARMALEASENRLRSLVDSAPFPIGVYTGKEMKIELANQSIIDVYGKGSDVIGKRYTEILPELENQEIFQQLDEVFTTGVPFHKRNQRIDIVVDGKNKTFYFNYSFTPLFDTDGSIYGVMNTAANITDLITAKQQMEQTEASLRGAIELADLGTWSIDLTNGVIDYSDRLKEWFGFEKEETITIAKAFSVVKESDKAALKGKLLDAIKPSSQNVYDVEYTMINKKTGKERIIHAQGRAFFNEVGNAYKVVGTAQDVTEQRKIQLALEQEVQLRTEELAASNEKLRTANEELAKTNNSLLHSNEELAQYAYVASHDLQEPLRKIRMFSSLLNSKDLAKGDKELIEKIKSSSERMSLLIQDLLEFSRLLKAETLMRPVNIASVIVAVIDDFELTIKEKNATIDVGELPIIEAVNLQMNQLFYNLLSNSLKFTTPDKPPFISIHSQTISHTEASKYIQHVFSFSQYYHITFADNGIGFEAQYAEQIFEVFKRLHGREVYPGSGIGLALCRRIVSNHNGHLFVESKLNNGTTFHIIIPDKQHPSQSSLPENFNWKVNKN